MKIYYYDKETLEFIREAEAQIDPMATKREGKEVYLLPMYATFIKVPDLLRYETAIFNKKKQQWEVKKSFKGYHKVNLKSGKVSEITDNRALRTNEVLINEELYKEFQEDPNAFAVIEGKFTNIKDNPKYVQLYNKRNYDITIRRIKEQYDEFLETPVTYKGAKYLPRYVDDYAKLATREFPLEIWDYTGMSSKTMNKAEFLALKKFLEDLVDKAYQEKKEKIKKLKKDMGK